MSRKYSGRRHRRVIDQDGAPVRGQSRLGYALYGARQEPETQKVGARQFVVGSWRAAQQPDARELLAGRVPQPSVTDPRPLQTAQATAGRTLGLRVASVPKQPAGVLPERRLEQLFGHIADRFTQLRDQVAADLASQVSVLELESARIGRVIGAPRRFTTPAGDVARMASAYAEGGTAELTGLAALVEQEIVRRAVAS